MSNIKKIPRKSFSFEQENHQDKSLRKIVSLDSVNTKIKNNLDDHSKKIKTNVPLPLFNEIKDNEFAIVCSRGDIRFVKLILPSATEKDYIIGFKIAYVNAFDDICNLIIDHCNNYQIIPLLVECDSIELLINFLNKYKTDNIKYQIFYHALKNMDLDILELLYHQKIFYYDDPVIDKSILMCFLDFYQENLKFYQIFSWLRDKGCHFNYENLKTQRLLIGSIDQLIANGTPPQIVISRTTDLDKIAYYSSKSIILKMMLLQWIKEDFPIAEYHLFQQKI